jgi:hypothetical protein
MKTSVKTQTAYKNLNKATKKYQSTANNAPTYNESGKTKSAYNQWTSYEKNNKPGEYAGTWADVLNQKVTNYINQDPYSYKSQNDASYQAAKDQYTKTGQQAMKDTMAQASALTGGYGNTYSQSVGQQQYNAQMDNLSQKAIEYEQQAYNRYVGDREQQLNTINALQNLDNTEYSRNRDAINDYNTFLNYLQNKYTTLKAVDDDTFNREYNVWQQQLGARGTLLSTAQNNYQYENTNDINNYQFDVNTDLQKQQLAETKRKNTADIKLGQQQLAETKASRLDTRNYNNKLLKTKTTTSSKKTGSSNNSNSTQGKVTIKSIDKIVENGAKMYKDGTTAQLARYLNNLPSSYDNYIGDILAQIGLSPNWLDNFYAGKVAAIQK